MPMHALPALKHAALDTEDGPDDMVSFFSIIDQAFGTRAGIDRRERITDEEVRAFHQVIAELVNYIRKTAPGPKAIDELLLRAR